MSNNKSILWFLGTTFAFSWTMFLIPPAFKLDPIAYQLMTTLFWAIGLLLFGGLVSSTVINCLDDSLEHPDWDRAI